MKTKFKFLPIAILFLLSLLATSAFAYMDTTDSQDKAESLNASISGVRPGSGVSTDMDQIAPDVCWSFQEDPGALIQILNLNGSYDYDKLERSLGVIISFEGHYDMFSTSPSAKFLRTLKETSLSMGFGYEATITQSINIFPYKLNDLGSAIYENPDTQPEFRNICGDIVFAGSPISKGEKLIVACNIHFDNKIDEEEFKSNFSNGFGSLSSMGTSIESFAKENNIKGTITLQAIQFGGTTAKLGQILSTNDDGYYATRYDLQDMTACNLAINSILDYIKHDYPNQIFDENGKLNNKATYLLTDPTDWAPAEEYGIDPGPSQVTPEVEKARLELAQIYKENKYYLDKLTSLRDHYPVKLAEKLKTKLDILIERAKNNDSILMDQNSGAVKCFNIPSSSVATRDAIMAKITPITTDDLDSLNLEAFKYYYRLMDSSSGSYINYMYDGLDWGVAGKDGDYEYYVSSFIVTPSEITISGTYKWDNGLYDYEFNGDSDGGKIYSGNFCVSESSCVERFAIKKENPYYFKSYQQ
ncbi:MAG: hypothetical protein GY710_01400 [Desulfobacteraceae bacterium]|nr:hypothetical protein [Desulfobacteraceae bacterium]